MKAEIVIKKSSAIASEIDPNSYYTVCYDYAGKKIVFTAKPELNQNSCYFDDVQNNRIVYAADADAVYKVVVY